MAASSSGGLQASDVLVGYSDWPGYGASVSGGALASSSKKPERCERKWWPGSPACPLEHADAARLLALVRGHWHIENQSHWVRDVTFDEDRSQVRCGNIPQVMATLRNTVIGLMRKAGYTEHSGGVSPICGSASVSAGSSSVLHWKTEWPCTRLKTLLFPWK